MRDSELRDRTKQFALRVVKMSLRLPRNMAAEVMGRQVLRSATSVAANFREATRARSDAEFIAKLGLVEQELDETMLWLELIVESGIASEQRISGLRAESDELLRIVIASIRRKKSARPLAKPRP